jgi:outer membrane protein assembly factor BamB
VGTLWSEWGELLLRAEKPRDMAPFVARLRDQERRGDLDSQPALQRSADWQGREEVRRVAERRHPWPTGGVTVERLPGPRPVAIGRTQPLAIDGPRGPYLTDVTLELGTGDQQLVARGPDGRSLWKLALQAPLWGGNAQFNRAWVRDHLLVLLVGKDLLAVDLLGTPQDPGPRWLWHQNLIEASAAIMVQRGLAPAQARLNFAPLGPDNTAVVGPISQRQIVVLKGRRLSALDPFTGVPLWTREGITPGSGLLGNDDELFVVPPETLEAQVYGARDGASRGTARMPPSSWWLTPRGGQLVVWGRPLDRQVLALRDLASGEDVWSREFPTGSLVAQVEGEEALVLDGRGHLTCVDLTRGEVRFEIDLEPGESINELQVVRTGEHYLVMANRPLPNGPTIVRHSQNVHLTVNGTVHLLERASGKWLWSASMERQQFDPQQPAGLPLVTFASHVFEPRRGGNGLEQRFLMTSLDRRTGKLLYEESRGDEPLHFIDYRLDEEAQTIELQLFQSVVKFTFSEK